MFIYNRILLNLTGIGKKWENVWDVQQWYVLFLPCENGVLTVVKKWVLNKLKKERFLHIKSINYNEFLAANPVVFNVYFGNLLDPYWPAKTQWYDEIVKFFKSRFIDPLYDEGKNSQGFNGPRPAGSIYDFKIWYSGWIKTWWY